MVNEWTKDDLPGIPVLRQADDTRGTGERSVTLGIALDEVVAHFNEHHPKPDALLSEALAQRDAAEGREAQRAEQVEKYRDRLREVRRARDEAVEASALFQRDANQWRAELSRVAREMARRVAAVREDYRDASSQHDWLTLERDDARRDRDEWHVRAKAAEARTAPAVTRDEVEAALAQGHRMAFGTPVVSIEEAVEAVCGLFGVDAVQAPDPVEERADELAREFWKMLEPDDGPWIGYEDAHGEGGHPRVLIVDRIARHLAEQESKR